ncbi:YkgJ family cysteine cluster protein [Magnetospirillum sp. UT-4]|uniref:YkgJ family cysteine cluster protein n=1 Tax=Magnetospirillum sp. UT-4 TaxID=2681467 RepID=UPI001386375B|nr:YkgJ family cysteine cluster protein [Magnetospirillum sp. UT-4]CAA7622659.1 conserved hypothetical protein [Magnetospirillum sp. UT-4]
MVERRFACTACGKCCVGRLPLTFAEVPRFAAIFPMAVVLTPVRQGHKAFDTTARLGLTVRLKDKRQVALRVAPNLFLPPAEPCPCRGEDGLCRIHDSKPLRCRAMPFLAWRDEADQAELLIPRPGWACGTGPDAPVVYRDKAVVERAGFDAERADLRVQAALVRAYGEMLGRTVPGFPDTVARAAARPNGEVVLSLATLLPMLDCDLTAIAGAQAAVLATAAERTADSAFRAQYGAWERDMQRLIRRAAQGAM